MYLSCDPDDDVFIGVHNPALKVVLNGNAINKGAESHTLDQSFYYYVAGYLVQILVMSDPDLNLSAESV